MFNVYVLRTWMCIITTCIRRIGKVMFSQMCVCPHPGGTPVPGSYPGPLLGKGYPSPGQGSTLVLAGGTTVLVGGGVPQSQLGGTPGYPWP